MWVKRLINIYSLNKKILRPFEANVQIGKTKSKTHAEIKSCTTECVKLQFRSRLHRIKVSFLTYISATLLSKWDIS